MARVRISSPKRARRGLEAVVWFAQSELPSSTLFSSQEGLTAIMPWLAKESRGRMWVCSRSFSDCIIKASVKLGPWQFGIVHFTESIEGIHLRQPLPVTPYAAFPRWTLEQIVPAEECPPLPMLRAIKRRFSIRSWSPVPLKVPLAFLPMRIDPIYPAFCILS